MAFAGMLSAINALCHPIISSVVQMGGPVAALNLFGFSAVIVFAIFSLERISGSEGEPEAVLPLDNIALIAAFGAALVPLGQLSGVATFCLGLWLVLSSDARSRCRRLGVVMLALSGPLLWGQIALSLFSEQLLSWDAHIVGALAHSPVTGNVVNFKGRHTTFFIMAPCSSVSHLTLATLLWATVTQLARKRVDWGSLLLCGAAMLSVVVMNILRLTAIATFPDAFFTLHDGWLAQLFGWAALLLAGGIVAAGTARAARL
jgi:exosortase/archaeosortase family protein